MATRVMSRAGDRAGGQIDGEPVFGKAVGVAHRGHLGAHVMTPRRLLIQGGPVRVSRISIHLKIFRLRTTGRAAPAGLTGPSFGVGRCVAPCSFSSSSMTSRSAVLAARDGHGGDQLIVGIDTRGGSCSRRRFAPVTCARGGPRHQRWRSADRGPPAGRYETSRPRRPRRLGRPPAPAARQPRPAARPSSWPSSGAQRGVSIADQRIHQRVAGFRVIPVTRRLTQAGVVIVTGQRRAHRARQLPGRPGPRRTALAGSPPATGSPCPGWPPHQTTGVESSTRRRPRNNPAAAARWC